MSHYVATEAFARALVARGLVHAVVSPGLRSVPLSLVVDALPGLAVTVVHDERVAGFTALGVARATNQAVLVVCTSGSALANLFPAIVEAHHARIPLVLATGDRPPELHGWDSPQTIDQRGIYGSFARSIELPEVDELPADAAAAAAATAMAVATGLPGGPVHVNWPFREPLEPPLPLVLGPVSPLALDDETPAAEPDDSLMDAVTSTRRGLIAAGELGEQERAACRRLAAATGWPIIADPLSGLRTPDRDPTIIAMADHLLGHASWADEHVPDLVVRVGSPPTSKSLRLWMERTRPKRVVVVDAAGRRRDPSRTMTDLAITDLSTFGAAVARFGVDPDARWLQTWQEAEHAARRVVAAVAEDSFEEAAATRATAQSLDRGSIWHVASSTPIRDVDWYVDATAAHITSNRGANGIDGTVATATGLSIGSRGSVLVTLGDVAAVHDAGGILAAGRSESPPTIVVYANGGGGIFSLLPIVTTTASDAFDRVLHTPVDVDFRALASAAGYSHVRVDDRQAMGDALTAGIGGEPLLVEVEVSVAGSRDQLVKVRSEIAARL